MNSAATRSRPIAPRIGWLASIAVCVAVVGALGFNVHAVRSEALLAERQIVSLGREIQMLETEFQARASQRQLANWNAIELGYEAPRADQYLNAERQLASLGVPAGPDAPEPIRVALAAADASSIAARPMASPVSGEPVAVADARKPSADTGAVFAAAFGDFIIDASPIRAANASAGLIEARARESAE